MDRGVEGHKGAVFGPKGADPTRYGCGRTKTPPDAAHKSAPRLEKEQGPETLAAPAAVLAILLLKHRGGRRDFRYLTPSTSSTADLRKPLTSPKLWKPSTSEPRPTVASPTSRVRW